MSAGVIGFVTCAHVVLGAVVYRFIGWPGVIGGVIGIALYYATH